MPIKLEFPDKSSRMHFERVMREKCKIKAAMSLPPGIRKEAEKVRKTALEKFPGKLVMVRAESDGQQFVVFHKCDGDPKWVRDSETFPIPDFRSPSARSCPSRTSPWRARFGSSSHSSLSPS
jgi:hypothetical protein